MSGTELGKFTKAYADIVSAIERGEFDDSKYFPSAAFLAGKIGVSIATVWKVIRLLRHEGRLSGAFRSRPMLPGREPESPPGLIDAKSLPPRQTKSYVIQRRIRSDLLNGRLRHDRPLPAEKELTAIYGVSRMTLRKALLGLTEQGILSRRGTGYSPAPIAPAASTSPQSVVLLGHGSNIGHSITYGYWHQESYKLLELECAKARMAMEVVCFFREEGALKLNDERPRRIQDTSITNRSDVAGFIYLVTGADSIEDDLLLTVAKSGRPVAIFDELGIWPTPAFLRRHPNVRVFRNTISALPAQEAARYLLELGHRTAVYISPFHHLEYSRVRYDGLAREFAAAEGARIAAVTSGHEANQGSLPPQTKYYLDKMRKAHSAAMKTIPPDYRAPAEDRFVPLSTAVDDWEIRESVRCLCEQALKVDDATAWVLVNDICAAWAIDILEERRIDVPGKISLISFDDLPIALAKGMSSYNFNFPAVMIAMLGYIANPRFYPASKRTIEIEGHVIPRKRTLRALAH